MAIILKGDDRPSGELGPCKSSAAHRALTKAVSWYAWWPVVRGLPGSSAIMIKVLSPPGGTTVDDAGQVIASATLARHPDLQNVAALRLEGLECV